MEISYRLQFIYSPKFIAGSLSSYVNNLAEGIHKIKKNMDAAMKIVELNTKTTTVFLNTQTSKMI